MVERVHFLVCENDIYSPVELAYLILLGGGKWIQLRLKNTPRNNIISIARKVRDLTKRYGATLIINDYPDVCAEVGADGVHLGKNDMNPVEARRLLPPNAIIGYTINSIDDINKDILSVVDYVGVGPFAETKTKKGAPPPHHIHGIATLIRAIKHVLDIPVICIGGIKHHHVRQLFTLPIHGIAVFSALFDMGGVPISTATLLWLVLQTKSTTTNNFDGSGVM